MRQLTSSVLSCLLVSLGLFAAAPSAQAQLPDVFVNDFDIVQIVQSDSFDLIGDRPALFRVDVGVNGGGPDPVVDGILRMFVGGQEHAQSPIFSANGPFTATGTAVSTQGGTTLNFVVMPPISNDVVFEIELNPDGPNQIAESNTNNNLFTTPSQQFVGQGKMDLVYAPIDYRPGGGGTPNVPNHELIKPSVGDNFVQGIYPGGNIFYRRIDAPSKLWTSSVEGTGSSLNNSLNSDAFFMSPQPDFIYGWVPGGLPYNGQAFLNGKAAMGNTQTIRHQRTYAHELGHNFGRSHNGNTLSFAGIDVEHHLWLTEGLGQMKNFTKFDIMAAGLLTRDAWVDDISLGPFFNHPVFNGAPLQAGPGLGPQIVVSGTWNTETGEVELEPLLELPSAEPVRAAEAGLRDLVLRGFAGEALVSELPITVRSTLDECAACRSELIHDEHGEPALASDTDVAGQPAETVLPFVTLLPARGELGQRVTSLEIAAAGDRPVLTERRQASENAPRVEVLGPSAGEAIGSSVELRWLAIDDDGDELFTSIRYAPDGGDRRVPIARHVQGGSLTVDLSELPHFRAGAGFFEFLVSDGLNTTVVRSDPLQGAGAFAGAGGNVPFVEIYHPDDGRFFAVGSELILHASAWDLEDLELPDNSIAWSSDIDGPLGTGRRLLVDDLSAGTHVITVTGTDSGGQQDSASNTIDINPRDLPYAYAAVCQNDLGFGGPGNATLSLCGGDLSTGGTANLRLEQAAPFAPVFMFLGLSNNPTPAKGGVVVPVPWVTILNLGTNGDGELFLPGITSDGPLTFYLQAVIADGSQTLGYAFSNALEVQF